ncbi:MAG TPA: acyl carrier protein [Firmicutes bacterium]|nr:acyl carrier protein [Bacillota bacterium]
MQAIIAKEKAEFPALSTVLEILADVLEIPAEDLAALPEDADLADKGMDSLRYVQFVVAAEDRFSIEIRDDDLLVSKPETVGTLCSMLRTYFQPDQPGVPAAESAAPGCGNGEDMADEEG